MFVRVIDMPPTTSALYRTLAGGLMLLVLMRVRSQRFTVGRRAGIALLCAGVLFAADLAFWHRSIYYVGPGLATLLGNLQVLVLALVGVLFLGERFRWVTGLSLLMAVAGLGLMVGFDWSVFDSRYRMGLIFGLMTAVVYAGYILALRSARMAEPESPVARDLAMASLMASLFLGASCWAEGVSLAIPSLADAGLLAGYALVAQVVGWSLISSALPHVPTSLVGLILLLQPALAFVWDVVLFARPITLRELAGALAVLGALYLGARVRR